jgi:hypothetical protein
MIEVEMTPPEDAIFNFPLLVQGCERAVREANRRTKKILDDTKKDFSARSQFEFEQEQETTLRHTRASTWTDDENYIRLNQGTDDHIVGKRGQLMSFLPDYKPKTRPFTPRSRSGGGSGPRQAAHGPWRVRGIEPRGFIITAYSLVRGRFHKDIDQAYRNALAR